MIIDDDDDFMAYRNYTLYFYVFFIVVLLVMLVTLMCSLICGHYHCSVKFLHCYYYIVCLHFIFYNIITKIL